MTTAALVMCAAVMCAANGIQTSDWGFLTIYRWPRMYPLDSPDQRNKIALVLHNSTILFYLWGQSF